MSYGYTKKSALNFDRAVEKITEELATEGFGVLTTINVKDTLKKKLNVDFDNYIILGACNPPFAYTALKAEHEIGLLLPCNVIVYEKDDEVFVSSILPTTAMAMVESEDLQNIAQEIEDKLKKVINNVD
ncbi:MAG: hypothetical protein CMI56_02895 [Parcubacteria group bacterium]|nr:hypothetical protein [Parcubacteria group bacterium]|tara:strand:+ start:3400 stop:3786 length:387 start_codon:yes stop_codon:yes gene_type:complete